MHCFPPPPPHTHHSHTTHTHTTHTPHPVVPQVVASGEVPERDFSLLHNLCWVGNGSAVCLASSSGVVYTFAVKEPLGGGPANALSNVYTAVLSALLLFVAVCVAFRASPTTVLASFMDY